MALKNQYQILNTVVPQIGAKLKPILDSIPAHQPREADNYNVQVKGVEKAPPEPGEEWKR